MIHGRRDKRSQKWDPWIIQPSLFLSLGLFLKIIKNLGPCPILEITINIVSKIPQRNLRVSFAHKGKIRQWSFYSRYQDYSHIAISQQANWENARFFVREHNWSICFCFLYLRHWTCFSLSTEGLVLRFENEAQLSKGENHFRTGRAFTREHTIVLFSDSLLRQAVWDNSVVVTGPNV